MKDSVVRGRVLQLLHERRSEGFLPFGAAERAVPAPEGINNRDWLRALAQLAEYNLIDWKPIEDKSGMGLLGGFARINELGTHVLTAVQRRQFESLSMNGGRWLAIRKK